VHRHQRALHAAERRHRHPARDEHTKSEPRIRRKWATWDSEAPEGYLEIAMRRREARGRDAAASSVDRDATWRDSVAERVGGEPERSAARARRAPPPPPSMVRSPLKPFSGCFQMRQYAAERRQRHVRLAYRPPTISQQYFTLRTNQHQPSPPAKRTCRGLVDLIYNTSCGWMSRSLHRQVAN
jgi:hypothetical protein